MGPPEALPKIFSFGLPENSFWDVRSSWVRRRLCPKFFRLGSQKILSGMFVPHGSAGRSAQNFFVRTPRKCFLGCLFLMGPPEALPKIFSFGLPERRFLECSCLLGPPEALSKIFSFGLPERSFLECSFLLGPPEALPKIFSFGLPERRFLECSFLLGPPEAMPRIFSFGLPENTWNVRSSWIRWGLRKKKKKKKKKKKNPTYKWKRHTLSKKWIVLKDPHPKRVWKAHIIN